jgi:hypothetical protein
MDLQAEKLKLVQAVLDIGDIKIIKEVEDLLKSHDHDPFDELTGEQQQAVYKSLEKLDKGERIPHQDAMARLGL